MNARLNPLKTTIEDLFVRINIINGYLYQLNIRLDSHKKMLIDIYNKNGNDISILYAGTALAISDLTEYPDSGWRNYYPSGIFKVQGEEYILFADEIKNRESLLSIVLAYESFETFLKTITLNFLNENRSYINYEKYNEFKQKNNTDNIDMEHWNKYLAYTYKDRENNKNNKYFKFIREVSPQFSDYEKNNNRLINLISWYIVLSEVRHSVHSNFIIKINKYKKFTKLQQEILIKHFAGKITDKGYELSCDYKSAENIFRLLLEYGYLVFKSLSMSANYEIDILCRDK